MKKILTLIFTLMITLTTHALELGKWSEWAQLVENKGVTLEYRTRVNSDGQTAIAWRAKNTNAFAVSIAFEKEYTLAADGSKSRKDQHSNLLPNKAYDPSPDYVSGKVTRVYAKLFVKEPSAD